MIFLSHSSADKPRLQPLVAALQDRDVEVWFDAERIHLADSIPQAMSGGLEASNRMIVAWSATAARSPHVGNEIDAFYMKHPEPGAMLFLRLDATEVPMLHAPRAYVAGSDPVSHTETIAAWENGKPLPFASTTPKPPTSDVLLQFPVGPYVTTDMIPSSLVEAYATLVYKGAPARALVDKAIRMRRQANPGDPNMTLLRHSELPQIDVTGSRDYWMQAFSLAGLHSPRMLAALILAYPPDQFDEQTKRERAELLIKLRLHDLPTEETQ